MTPAILCGGSSTRLCPLSSTSFPKQFLCLTGSIPLEIMEVQTVSYLGEDDIFRYKDTYGKEN